MSGMRQPKDGREAIEMFDSGWWEDRTPLEIAVFQLSTDLLCMPFPAYHEAVEEVLGRPVLTHEFSNPQALLDELNGKVDPPTVGEVISSFEQHFPVVVVRTSEGEIHAPSQSEGMAAEGEDAT